MIKEFIKQISVDDHVGCFGNFNIVDPVCKKFCALSLRCAIDRNHNNRMELLEDLISSDDLSIKIQ